MNVGKSKTIVSMIRDMTQKLKYEAQQCSWLKISVI